MIIIQILLIFLYLVSVPLAYYITRWTYYYDCTKPFGSKWLLKHRLLTIAVSLIPIASLFAACVLYCCSCNRPRFLWFKWLDKEVTW